MVDTKRLLELSSALLPKLTSDIIVILSKTGTILYINEKMEAWLGYKREELVNHNIARLKIMSPRFIAKALQSLAARYLGKDIPPYNLEFIAKDGKTLNATVRGQLIRDENGKAVADLAVITDITNKAEIEKELYLEKQKSEKYFNLVRVMILILDNKGAVSLINDAGVKMLGYDNKEEIIGKNWFDNFLPKKMTESVKVVFDKLITGEIESLNAYENPVLTKEGKEKVIHWSNSVLKNSQGKIEGVISSGMDVTGQKETEQVLNKRAEELKELNEAMVGRELKMIELKKQLAQQKGGEQTE